MACNANKRNYNLYYAFLWKNHEICNDYTV